MSYSPTKHYIQNINKNDKSKAEVKLLYSQKSIVVHTQVCQFEVNSVHARHNMFEIRMISLAILF